MNIAPLKLIIFLLLVSSAFGEEVVLKDKTGKALKVRLVNITEGSVKVLLLSNGRKYDIPLDKLEEESLQQVRQWREGGGHLSSRFKVSYISGKKDRKDRGLLTLEPKVTVENDALGMQATKPVEMYVYILGKPIEDKRDVYVLAKEVFEIPSMPELGSHSVKLEEIEESYLDGYAKFGYKYLGYAIFLLSEDVVIYDTFTPSYLGSKWNFGSELLKSQQGDTLKP